MTDAACLREHGMRPHLTGVNSGSVQLCNVHDQHGRGGGGGTRRVQGVLGSRTAQVYDAQRGTRQG